MPPVRPNRFARTDNFYSSNEDEHAVRQRPQVRRINHRRNLDRVSPVPRYESFLQRVSGTSSESEKVPDSATMSEDNERLQPESFDRSSRDKSPELKIIEKAEYDRNVHNKIQPRHDELGQSSSKTKLIDRSRNALPSPEGDSQMLVRDFSSSDVMELSSRPPSQVTGSPQSARSPSPAIQLDNELSPNSAAIEADLECPSSRGSSPDVMLQDKYPEILQALSELGYRGFREQQAEAVDAVLEDRDVVVRLATGAGKTLVALLPAYYRRDGLTVVVVPTLSLLRQHVLAMLEKNVLVVAFNSKIRSDIKSFHASLLSSGATSCHLPLFAFVTPEQIRESDFRRALQTLYDRDLLSRFVIDEAHLMLEWSSFRAAYSELKIIRALYPGVPITALSATLSDAHIQWLTDTLQLEPDTRYILGTLNRPNLCHEIIHCRQENILSTLIGFVQDNCLNKSTIIYCPRVKDCDKVCKQLRSKSVRCVRYVGTHHTRPGEQATSARHWDTGTVDIIVATTAFGVGIDKPDVRFILHYGAPLSFNDWAQKSGRAGRDGRVARDIVFYCAVHLEMHLALVASSIQSEDNPLKCPVESVRESTEFNDCASQPSAPKCSNCRREAMERIVDVSPFASAVVAVANAWNGRVTNSPTTTRLASVVTNSDLKTEGVRDLRAIQPELFGTAKTLVCAEWSFILNQRRARDLVNMLTAVGIFHLTHVPGHKGHGWIALSANEHAEKAIETGQAIELWLPDAMFVAAPHVAPGICSEYETSGAEADHD